MIRILIVEDEKPIAELIRLSLRRAGYQILAANWRSRFGEIDLIARSPEGVLCFGEVQTRTSSRFAAPREAVTPAKQRKLRTTAEYYLARTGQGECFCRFDVAEVYPALEGEPTINYITNAF